jgi:rRNA processing protein Gar1
MGDKHTLQINFFSFVSLLLSIPQKNDWVEEELYRVEKIIKKKRKEGRRERRGRAQTFI